MPLTFHVESSPSESPAGLFESGLRYARSEVVDGMVSLSFIFPKRIFKVEVVRGVTPETMAVALRSLAAHIERAGI